MLLPVKWLSRYVDIDVTSKVLADGLTYSGSHVESINRLDKGIENIVVGRIDQLSKHPDADKLLVCKVNIGREILTIVTGATNLKEGDYVPVALIGAKLPIGLEIGETNFRGVDSQGMLCSLKELGYEDNVVPKEVRDGIFVFDKEYPLGEDAVKFLDLDEDVIEFEITPNRPDCLSIFGMARETAATFNKKLKHPEIKILNQVDDIYDYSMGIEVQTPNCYRYYSRVVKDVKIGPSPLWLQTSLMNAGVRPINNVVDVTNFVMMEFGEPLHAFDLEKLNGKKIIVRQALDDEKLTTLDGVVRNLNSDDIIIADDKKPIGIAGIMGGLDSEITPSTKTVLLEGANFSSRHVRMTSKKFALRTEASTRFEKGIDPNLCSTAVERVCQLIEEIGAGTVVRGIIDVNQTNLEDKIIKLRPERSEKLLGVKISVDEMIQYLDNLGFNARLEKGLIITKVPTFRGDVDVEADLIEEVGRLYGFHNIKSQPLVGGLTRGERPYNKQVEIKVKNILQGLGYNEVMTYSFISPRAYDKLNLPEDAVERKYIKLLNPLGEDYSTMRTTLMSNMLELLSRNEKKGVEDVLAYEIGYTFMPKALPVTELPTEKQVLSIGFYGDKDFYFMKESLELVLQRLGINNVEYFREGNNPSYHPGRTAVIKVDGKRLGLFGEVHPDVCENYNIKNRVYLADIDFDSIVGLTNTEIKYKPLPKYPAITRDIAVVVNEDVMVGELERIIKDKGNDLVEKIVLFDIYRGNQVEENKKSVAFSIIYRSFEGTLTDDVVNNIQSAIIKEMESQYEAKLRS